MIFEVKFLWYLSYNFYDICIWTGQVFFTCGFTVSRLIRTIFVAGSSRATNRANAGTRYTWTIWEIQHFWRSATSTSTSARSVSRTPTACWTDSGATRVYRSTNAWRRTSLKTLMTSSSRGKCGMTMSGSRCLLSREMQQGFWDWNQSLSSGNETNC